MLRRRLVLGSTLVLALPVAALLKSCGFSARIDVITSFFDRSEFVAAQRCGTGQTSVDIVYVVLNGEGRLMTKDDPLFQGGAFSVVAETPDAFTIANQPQTVGARVSATSYVEITRANRSRAIALLLDNSESVDGWDEVRPDRNRLAAPTDSRRPAPRGCPQLHQQPEALGATDRATVISFNGEGMDGVHPRLAQTAGESPRSSWFTGNTTLLSEKIAELNGQTDGRTPLYDAISVGVQALRTLPPAVRPIVVLFSDGPDNSSNPFTFDDAKNEVLTQPSVPVFSIGLGTLLAHGEAELVDLACSTDPQGVYLKAPLARDLGQKFEHMKHLVTGYYKTTLDLTLPQGLPTGTYTVRGRMFAEPLDRQGQSTRTCSDTNACSRGPGGAMECDTARGRCYMNVSFTISVP